MRLTSLLASVFGVLLLLAACDKPAPATPPAQGATRYNISDADAKLIAEKFPQAVASRSGLLSILVKEGASKTTPRYGAVASVAYSLRLLDGTFIEASAPGEPLRFPVGVNRVIRGWDEALMTMTKGEKRTLIIPHYLGYGVVGNPPKIPPYATLVFEVELIDFK